MSLVGPSPARLRQRRDLVVALVARDVALRYRRSLLGLVWSQMSPLVTLAVLTFLFTQVVPLDIPHYVPFVLMGLLSWTWWSGALLSATGSVVGAADLVRRPGFPVSSLPVVAVASHLVHLVLALPVLALAVVLSTGRLPATAPMLVPLLLLQAAITVGPAWILAAGNVRFRDVQHLVGVLLLPLFYATPVFYDTAAVPDGARRAYQLNPLVHLLEAQRSVVIDGRMPEPAPLVWLALLGLALAIAGRRAFLRLAPSFPDEL